MAMQCDPYSDIIWTRMMKFFSNQVIKFRIPARVMTVSVAIAIACPSHGNLSQSNIPQPANALALQTGDKHFPQTLAKGARVSTTTENAGKSNVVGNRKPVATTDVINFEISSSAFNALVNDYDPDGDRLILTDALAQFGAVAFTPEGLIGYAQNPGPPRADQITYTISDNAGNFARGTIQITVR